MFHVRPCCLRLYKACAGLCISNATSHRNGAQISLFFGPEIMWMQLAGTELLLAPHREAKFPANPPRPLSSTGMLRGPAAFTFQPTGDLHLSASTLRRQSRNEGGFPSLCETPPAPAVLWKQKQLASAVPVRSRRAPGTAPGWWLECPQPALRIGAPSS